MSIVAILMSIVGALAEREAPKFLGWVESKLPGSFGAFVQHVLGLPSVQDWAKAEEAKALALAGKFTADGLAKLESDILPHIHGALGDFIKAQLGKVGAITFSPEQAAQLQILAASGKLDALLKQFMADVTGAAPAVTP